MKETRSINVPIANSLVSPFDMHKDRNRIRRTVFYGRVSTEHEAQLSALENQIKWYDDQAAMHSNWDVLDKYIDEGITGTQAKKRPSFLRMIEDAKKGKFDLIVTREVCRFARNTVDTLVTTRELKNLGIEVYFVEDNIWTMDGDGELRLTIMATLAQEESRKVSERVKAGQHISRTKGVVYGSGNILGYDKVNGTYVINEEQAETVKMIYDLYTNEGIGMSKLADELLRQGRLNASGELKWAAWQVGNVLRNPTYMGVQAYGKSFSNNYLEQRRINNHNADSYMVVEADFPAIISEGQWKEAERVRNKRKYVVDTRVDPYLGEIKRTASKPEPKRLWVKKVRCGCGCTMRRNKWHKRQGKEWSYGLQCYGQLNHGSAKKRRQLGLSDKGFCDNRSVPEWKFECMCYTLFKNIFDSKTQAKALKQACDILEQCYQDKAKKLSGAEAIEQDIKKLQEKIGNLIDLRTEGEITKDEYRSRRHAIENEIEKLQVKLKETETVEADEEEVASIRDIKKALEQAIEIKGAYVDPELIDSMVLRVIVPDPEHFIWYINVSGRDIDPDDLPETYVSKNYVIDFKTGELWRKKCGDYLRVKQWSDLNMELRLV